MVKQALTFCTLHADLCGVLWPSAKSSLVRSTRVVMCDSGEAALEDSRRYTLYNEMHAEGEASIPQGALENGDRTRALSLHGCTHRVHDDS